MTTRALEDNDIQAIFENSSGCNALIETDETDWGCEICAYRYNCPLHPEECLDEEQGCEYYIPDIDDEE